MENMCRHLGIAECRISFPGHCGIDLWPEVLKNCVPIISPIFFKVGVPNLVCGYIFGSHTVYGLL